MATENPVFHGLLHLKLRLKLHAKGIQRDAINTSLDGLTPDLVAATAKDNGITLPTDAITTSIAVESGPEANGQIIAAILAFFESAQGQALISALVTLLIGLIGGG